MIAMRVSTLFKISETRRGADAGSERFARGQRGGSYNTRPCNSQVKEKDADADDGKERKNPTTRSRSPILPHKNQLR